MKKSKIKLLSVAACLALVGTASAAWAYAGTATQSASIGVKVAAYADAGSITVSGADNLRVYLDNGSVTFTKENADIPFTATYTKPEEFASETKTVTLTYQVVISSYITTYVTFDSTVTSTTQSDNSIATGYDYTWTSGSEISLDSLPKLAWKESTENGSVFKDKSSYITLVGQMTGNSIGNDFDQNTVWDGKNKIDSHYVKINFKAEVANS